ncbi:hypothetical protein NDA11_002201 [Ustilago hordei]|uniref:Uncharacterized protein n=1 Tax=Ustilago hordei TaxID=120017 RepID=I2FLZ0_USTHO|nr:hypothetical protein NDA11_002201 [Ustilago hordei]KAJ1602041.1 hypothetical protein NDA14_000986 [Ustilago hordei]CCF47933.1 uncharacterized protein UHOR_00928 [Ustilago hordei]
MAVRSCARPAHQLAASILSNGVGPSRLPASLTCRCHSHPTLSNVASPTRHFSVARTVREQEALRLGKGDQQPQNSNSNSSSKAAEKSVLLEEVIDAEPTLEYLDSLKPRAIRYQMEPQHSRRDNSNPFSKASKSNPEDKRWEKMKARINASFTRDQLLSLARAAKLPGSYSTKVRKDDLVRRIMIHRFGMEDARERADREKREELQKQSVHISFRPAELYLLLARGSAKVRQEASKAPVAILPRAPKKEAEQAGNASEQLGFWIRGKEEGIERMKNWVQSFKQSIKTKEEQVTLLSGDAQAASGEALPQELVRFLSQLSRCFIEASPIQDGKVKLSLAYLDERTAQKAVLLLRQYHAENADAMQRLGAAAIIEGLDTTKQYAMLPFVHNEPTSWIKQADDLLYGSQSDLSFRVTHVPVLNSFSILTAQLSAMKLQGWGNQGEMQLEEPFKALLDNTSDTSTVEAQTAEEVECSAKLGYVLFNGGGLTLVDEGLSEEEALSRLQDPLAAPRPGIWPIQPTLDWSRNFRTRFGREASRFVPATLFRPQKNISLDIWLDGQNYTLVGKGTPEVSSEKMVLVYHPADVGYSASARKLEVVLARQQSKADAAEGAQGGWSIERASWVSKAESDVMIPEKSADFRLTAKSLVSLEADAHAAVEESVASFLYARPTEKVERYLMLREAETETEIEETEGESEVKDLLGSGIEIVDQDTASTADQTKGSNSLPPSTLNLPSGGVLALESATRMTLQTYQQRSSLPEAAPQATTPIATPEAASRSETESWSVPAESSADSAVTPAADAVAEATSDAVPTPTSQVEAEAAPITTAKVTAAAESSSPEPASSAQTQQALCSTRSPLLVREISQDLITESTTESLRIVWHSIPTWKDAVQRLSAIVDRHDISIR